MARYRKKRYRKGNDVQFLIFFAVLVFGGVITILGQSPEDIVKYAVVVAILLLVVFTFFAFLVHYRKKKAQDEYFIEQKRLEQLLIMDPIEFEDFVGWMFEKQGYSAKVTKKSGDHGIDLVLNKKGKVSVVQVKRYQPSKKIGEGELRDFYGSFAGQNIERGFFVTTSDFTPSAVKWATQKPITLLDGNKTVKIIQGFSRRNN